MKESERVRLILNHIRKFDRDDADDIVGLYNKHRLKLENIKFYFCKDSPDDNNHQFSMPMVDKDYINKMIANESRGFDPIGIYLVFENTKKLIIYLK